MRGVPKKIIAISGPSGSGKTTLINFLLAQDPRLSLAVSLTSRKPRKEESEGVEYFFVSNDNFKKQIKEKKLIEWKEVYPGLIYGTLKSELERIWDEGKYALLNVDVSAISKLKEKFDGNVLAIMLKPCDFNSLKERLRERGEDEESIKQRIKVAREEITQENLFDKVVTNEQGWLEEAKDDTLQVIKKFLDK